MLVDTLKTWFKEFREIFSQADSVTSKVFVLLHNPFLCAWQYFLNILPIYIPSAPDMKHPSDRQMPWSKVSYCTQKGKRKMHMNNFITLGSCSGERLKGERKKWTLVKRLPCARHVASSHWILVTNLEDKYYPIHFTEGSTVCQGNQAICPESQDW